MKKSDAQILIENKFPHHTDQAIQIMLKGYAVIKKELIIRLKKKNINPDLLKIIEEF